MFSKYWFLFIGLLVSVEVVGQQCELNISGYVIDSGSDEPLEYVNIIVSETGTGATTDSTGFFRINDLCPEEAHLVISHIGCETQQVYINVRRDTVLTLLMDHSENLLHDVVITGEAIDKSTQISQVITAQVMADQIDKDLSNMLEGITGVSVLKNGSGVAKPIIHGLYGNRLSILNNGVLQSGQQWGNDHSPEIDPLIAQKIRVIKGTAALEYFGSQLGGVILIDVDRLDEEPHLHGRLSYFYETNGRAHGTNLQLQQYNPKLSWKLNGTLKKNGDRSSPNYFLNNTGVQQANLAFQLQKSISPKLELSLYGSTFNSEIGILRGSHIGNITDLQTALARDEPFFTDPEFSYGIEAPRQVVSHHLLKFSGKYVFDDDRIIEVSTAAQLNDRKEYDVRRSGRTKIPALFLRQGNLFAQFKYRDLDIFRNWGMSTGLQVDLTDNTNQPETGILPLIPDYRSFKTGAFALFNRRINKSFVDVGLRYDQVFQNVLAISSTIPREIIRYDNGFHNFSASFGWQYLWSKHFTVSSNIGVAMRNPAINELYSVGVHQGVSGIEEGDPDLKSERSIKSVVSLKWKPTPRLYVESLFYYQEISDYIYLRPEEKFRLTVRGAFPVFIYDQTDAQIYGMDFTAGYELSPTVSSKLDYSYIRANDLEANIELINIPANNLNASLQYEMKESISLIGIQLDKCAFTIDSKWIFRKDELLSDQDFTAVPDGYQLLNAKLSFDVSLPHTRLRWLLRIDNMLDQSYRDYLNRQRYFADDLGRNVVLGLNVSF